MNYSGVQCRTCRMRVSLIAGLSLGVSLIVVVLLVLTTFMCSQQHRALKAKRKLKDKMAGCEETVVSCLTTVHLCKRRQSLKTKSRIQVEISFLPDYTHAKMAGCKRERYKIEPRI